MAHHLDGLSSRRSQHSWIREDKGTYFDTSDGRSYWKSPDRPKSIMKRGGNSDKYSARQLDLPTSMVRHIPSISGMTSVSKDKEGTKFGSSEKTKKTLQQSQLAGSTFQTVFNGEDPQDVTLHLELPVADDFEEELENFSVLRRLGNFKSAKDYFKDHLEHYLGHPFIFVQYASMLLEMGNYRAFQKLDAQSVFGPAPDAQSDELKLLHRQWKLLRGMFLMQREGTIDAAWEEARENLTEFKIPADAGSTEIQIMSLTLRICAHVDFVLPGLFEGTLDPYIDQWTDWQALLRRLLTEGRVWDFHDIFSAAYARIRPGREGGRLFDTSYDRLHEMTDIWRNDEDDEPTVLAILDMIMLVVLNLDISKDMMQSLRVPLQVADDCAEKIRMKFPESMNTRPYLRWILVKAAEFGCRGEKGLTDPFTELLQNVEDFPGKYVSYSDWIRTLIYVPRGIENPGWFMPEAPPEANQPVLAALNSAELLQDFPTQALCYKLLILRSKQPQKLFHDLLHLQGRVQGDREGSLRTRLTSYLACKERAEQDSLLKDLKKTSDWNDHRILRDPYLYWARDSITRALTRRTGGPKSTVLGPRTEAAYFRWLPQNIKASMEDHYGSRTHATAAHDTNSDDRQFNTKISSDATTFRGTTSVQIEMEDDPDITIRLHGNAESRSRSEKPTRQDSDRSDRCPRASRDHEDNGATVIRGPTIEREVITHYRDIDHGISPSKVSPRLSRPRVSFEKPETHGPSQRVVELPRNNDDESAVQSIGYGNSNTRSHGEPNQDCRDQPIIVDVSPTESIASQEHHHEELNAGIYSEEDERHREHVEQATGSADDFDNNAQGGTTSMNEHHPDRLPNSRGKVSQQSMHAERDGDIVVEYPRRGSARRSSSRQGLSTDDSFSGTGSLGSEANYVVTETYDDDSDGGCSLQAPDVGKESHEANEDHMALVPMGYDFDMPIHPDSESQTELGPDNGTTAEDVSRVITKEQELAERGELHRNAQVVSGGLAGNPSSSAPRKGKSKGRRRPRGARRKNQTIGNLEGTYEVPPELTKERFELREVERRGISLHPQPSQPPRGPGARHSGQPPLEPAEGQRISRKPTVTDPDSDEA